MASCTKIFKVRNNMKARKAGLARKNKIEREGSTPTRAAFFGDKEADKKSS